MFVQKYFYITYHLYFVSNFNINTYESFQKKKIL